MGAVPITTRSTPGRSWRTFVPAPVPIESTVRRGRASTVSHRARIRAIPVGVQSSPASGGPPASTCQPFASSMTAGGGTVRSPCWVLTVPVPSATGELEPWPTPSVRMASATPTMSPIESRAPTSWKWTSSTVVPWTAASALASWVNASSASMEVNLGTPSAKRSSLTSLRWRAGGSGSSAMTSTLRAAKGPRCTVRVWRCSFPGATRSRTAAMEPASAPASMRAASSMSPEAPWEASIQRWRVSGGSSATLVGVRWVPSGTLAPSAVVTWW